MSLTRKQVFDKAMEVIACGDIKTDGREPVIFTSDRKTEAESFVAIEPDRYALIHSTPAGAALEELNLFDHMSSKLAYLHWFYLSARFVMENDWPQKVRFFGNFENKTSTAFGIEIPLFYHAKPGIEFIHNPLSDVTVFRDQWMSEGLMRSYVLALTNTWMEGPAEYLTEEDAVLFNKFQEAANGLPTTEDKLEYRYEMALKLMTSGYLLTYGNFPKDPQRENSPLTAALI